MNRALLGMVVVLSGCQPTTRQACEIYVEAVESCYGSSFIASQWEDTCDGTGVTTEAMTALFECYTDVYNAGDCTTFDGEARVATNVLLCGSR